MQGSVVGALEHGRRNCPGTEGGSRDFSVTRVSKSIIRDRDRDRGHPNHFAANIA